MRLTHFLRVILTLFVCSGTLFSAGFDNRFLPWYPRVAPRTVSKRSFARVDSFFLTGNSAYGDASTERKGIPELWGTFDLRLLALASETVGNANRLRPAWQDVIDINWNVYGKVQGQGITFAGEYSLTDHLSFGGSTTFLHVTSNQKFVLPRATATSLLLTASDELEIDEDRRQTLKDLGFADAKWAESSLADSEFYIRYGWMQEYRVKCRQAGFGLVLGALLPSSKQRDMTNPAAIPFGGQHMSGIYCGADAIFEVKEDIWFNLMVKLSKRFSKIQKRRLPVKGEPEIFGATTGNVKIDPGETILFSPALGFDNIREGLGLQMQYVFATHAGDVWTDKRADTAITLALSKVNKLSKWKSEYVLFNVSYDLGKVSDEQKVRPLINFFADFPIKLLKRRDVAKTQRVGLSVEFRF